MHVMRIGATCLLMMWFAPSAVLAQNIEAAGAAAAPIGSRRTQLPTAGAVVLDPYYRLVGRGSGRGPDPELVYWGQQSGLTELPQRSMWLEICDFEHFRTALEEDSCSIPVGLRAQRSIRYYRNEEDLIEKMPAEPVPGRYYVLIWRENRDTALDFQRPPCQERTRMRPTSRTRICGWSTAFELKP